MPNFVCDGCGKPFNVTYPPKKCDKCGDARISLAPVVVAVVPQTVGKWTSHKNKHVFPRGRVASAVKSSTETGAAKYASGVNVKDIETRCLNALGNVGGIVDVGRMIGWCGGEDATHIEIYADITGFHGQPLSDDLATTRGVDTTLS